MQSVELNPIELVWDEVLIEKPELNNLPSRLRFGNSFKKWVEQTSVYPQSLVEKMPRIYKAVIAVILKNEKFKKSFEFFFCLICI